MGSQLFGRFDQFFTRFIGVDEKEVLRAYLRYFDVIGGEDLVLKFNELRSRQVEIDGKVSGLLSHISVMIAVFGVFIAFLDSTVFEKVIITLELILYLALGFLCLRCIQTDRLVVAEEQGSMSDVMERGIIGLAYKRETYRFLIRWTCVLTLILMIAVVFHIFLI